MTYDDDDDTASGKNKHAREEETGLAVGFESHVTHREDTAGPHGYSEK